MFILFLNNLYRHYCYAIPNKFVPRPAAPCNMQTLQQQPSINQTFPVPLCRNKRESSSDPRISVKTNLSSFLTSSFLTHPTINQSTLPGTIAGITVTKPTKRGTSSFPRLPAKGLLLLLFPLTFSFVANPYSINYDLPAPQQEVNEV